MKLPVFSRAYIILLALVLVNGCSLEDATEKVPEPASTASSGLNTPPAPTTDTSAPTTPTGLNATTRSTQVSLNWPASWDDVGVTGYEIFRDGTSLGTVTSNQFIDNAVTAGQSYSYQVLAFDLADNQSAKSTALFVGVPISPPPADTTEPTIPTGLSSVQTDVQVTLNWQASTDNVGVTGYEIFRDGVSRATVTTNQYTDAGVVSGQSYNYQVRAFDAAGNNSTRSNTLNVAVPNSTPPADTAAPTVPNGLSASTTTAQVILDWTASSDDTAVTGYEIFRDGVSQGTVATNQFTDNAVNAGQSYSYQVRAFDAAGNQSAKSNALGVDVPASADTTAPSVPSGLSASTTTVQVILDWTASSDDTAVTGYEIFRDGASQGTVTTNQFTDNAVNAGQSYSYQVRAFDAAGNQSAQSNALSVDVPAPPADTTAPSVPSGLSASTTTVQVSLNWTASSDDTAVTGYEVFRDGASQGTVATNQYTDNSVNSGQLYDYEVLAFDLAGNTSAKSAALSVTVPNVAASGAPVILYTDIVSGPASGGEGNNGAYLSIFGFNLGNPSTLGTTTKVYINDQEVARYMLIKNAMAQPMPNVKTMQQITVQIGALGGSTPGINYPVKLVAKGVASNTDKTFMIQPGDIYYVDNVNGNDTTGVKNDPTKPFRLVQAGSGGNGVLDSNAQPGDIVVMRGTGRDWTDLVGGAGQERFVRFRNITGSAPTGAVGTGPITLMGYPGENVVIQCQDDTRCGIHGVNGFDSSSLDADSDWITISSLRIRGGGPKVKDGPINLQHKSDNWRIVNNELFEWDGNNIDGKIIDGKSYGEARAGGITGDGFNVKILGNHIHDINGGTKNHGIYVDGGAQNWEIAYNHMERLFGGNIIQTFDSHGNGGNIQNIDIHHNRLHEGTRYGVNYSAGTATGKVYDNLIYNTAASGVRFSTASGTALLIAHNTLFNTCLKTGLNALDNSPTTKIPNNASAIANDWSGNGVKIQNNILHSNTNCSSYVGNTGSYGSMIIDNNLYTGLTASPSSRDGNAVTGNPNFNNIVSGDFRLGASSAALDSAAAFVDFSMPTDFLFNPRVTGASADIGAIEK